MVDAIREEYCSDQRPFQAEATFSTASVCCDTSKSLGSTFFDKSID